MVAFQRPVQLSLIFLYHACSARGWSFFGFGTGGSDSDGDRKNAEDVGTAAEDEDGSTRTLSSFFNWDVHHTIPRDRSVTPRGRRDIMASLKAHTWPTTVFSPLCEAWAYLEVGTSIGKAKAPSSHARANEEQTSWRYLDVLVEQGGMLLLDRWANDESNGETDADADGAHLWTFENSTSLAVQAAFSARESESSALDETLLPMALSLRAHSPHCEMQRSLARDAAIALGLYDAERAGFPPVAFSVVSRVSRDDVVARKQVLSGTRVILDGSLLQAAVSSLTSEQPEDRNASNTHDEDASSLLPLPEEKFYPKSLDDDSNIVAVLYGQVGTTAFASLYQSLKESQVKFVVRHMGYIPWEEETALSKREGSSDAAYKAIPTVLQGYGVRLDIRNVEYKAFDDGPDDKVHDGNAEPDCNELGHQPEDPARDEYLAGVNLNSLLERLEYADATPLPSDLLALQTALMQSHPTQQRSESIVPPAWRRRSLSLQAAAVIAASPDPLETLQGVSQNLPSVAHYLSSVQVPTFDSFLEGAPGLTKGLYVNGRLVDVDRPSFNVFQLLDVLREEDKRLQQLESKLRPLLKIAISAIVGKENSGAEWASLQAVRKILDLGPEKLAQMGKRSKDEPSTQEELEYYKDEEEEEENMSSSTEKYRIDVGRGGKKAVLYLNDIEKDQAYQQWPTSMQEMIMRSQYGGAPTVRRNLFTLLIVVDPSDGKTHPAATVAAQLLNGQFPLRLGLLIVDDEDVLKGSAAPPLPWNDGERPFRARDSFLLLAYISKEFAKFAAISCFVEVSQRVAELGEMSAKEYVESHISLLLEMRVIQSGDSDNVRHKMEVLLQSGTSDISTKAKAITYESAVQFAVDKLIRPGMSFFNGLPLPDSESGSFSKGVNGVLQYEQRHIMELVMKGVITDTAPKSIYATVLSGDKLFAQYHPILRSTSAEYLGNACPESDWNSLMLSTSTMPNVSNIDAIFLIEGVFDLDTSVGIESLVSFLELTTSPPESWHEFETISPAFRILSSGNSVSPLSQVLANIFNVASQFDPADLLIVVKALQETTSYEDINHVLSTIATRDIDADVRKKIAEAAKNEASCPVAKSMTPERKNFYTVNGRVYVPQENDSISVSDIQVLISFELNKSKAITMLVFPTIVPEALKNNEASNKASDLVIHHTIGTTAAILNNMMSASSKTQTFAATLDSLHTNSENNPLYFSWNDRSLSNGHLQVTVSVIVDPLTELTQRVAPLLIGIRDFLKLPLRLMIAPRKVVRNDVPVISYYRFVAEPHLFHDSNPNALFQNLPNHLLTLRMDVPEQWDVQQLSAVQDTDNLRCDARYGCGDEAHVLANKEKVDGQRLTKINVESTHIEYTVKSLLFFGQCYDVSQSTPPNGLQLTLDRSTSGYILKPESTAEIQPNGEQQLSDYYQAATPRDHADTLVMKTVGYWQLRANPGVWNLRIAEKSRGAEIYHQVEGTVGQYGKIQLSKESAESNSKTLVMKDFTNRGRFLLVKRRKGFEQANLFREEHGLINIEEEKNETVHVFSLATGHAYERLLKIMMLSVTKRTTSPVKFWLFENFLSPSFKSSSLFLAKQIGCEVEFVTYKWPEWLRGQTEKQRIIWGYKILFLDVLFPIDLKKIIYVDADQVVRGDMTELWNLDLEGKPYGYTPFCDSREETLGYQFWRTGFWKTHLRGRPYHISALYVVDLDRFRRELVGDKLRATYQQLSADPNSLSNLDQDLPNYAQHEVPIFSLPQKWLWCESWCSDETKADAMTIDLCNNPEHKEAKISMAKRIISGDLFEESWEELDALVASYDHNH